MTTLFYDSGGIQLWHGRAEDVLPMLDAASVDLVLTDPPYGIGYASSWTTQLGGTPRKHEASFGADEVCLDWIPAAAAALRDNAAAYVFTRWDVLDTWKSAIEDAGLKVVQRLVWDKAHFKMGDLRYYGSQLEDILFCVKGTPPLFWNKRQGNLYRFSSGYLPEGQLDHPTQKPLRLIKTFIEHATRPGDLVLDPFGGSGTTAAACKEMGRRCVSIECVERYCEIAARRLSQEVLALW
jgi:DNA modification methylase